LNRGPLPRPGDGMTVNLGAFLLAAPFEVAAGPGYRQLIDLGAPEESCWIIAGGVSGDPRSRHYADQLVLWSAGETRAMRFLEKDDAASSVLKLTPAKPAPRAPADCAALSRVL